MYGYIVAIQGEVTGKPAPQTEGPIHMSIQTVPNRRGKNTDHQRRTVAAAKRRGKVGTTAATKITDVFVSMPDGTLMGSATTGSVDYEAPETQVLTVGLTLTNALGAITVGGNYLVDYKQVINGINTPCTEDTICSSVPADATSKTYTFDILDDQSLPAPAAPEATTYKVEIDMSSDTVSKLRNGLYNLYGFKSVQTDTNGGAPLVWFATEEYSTVTQVDWQEQYAAYTSTQTEIPDGTVTATTTVNIDLGETFKVDGDGGTGEVMASGPSITAIAIDNKTTAPYTCGLAQNVGGVVTPLCDFPLYGGHQVVIAPVEKVLLMFSSSPYDTGAVVEQAFSPGILIDLTANNSRKVSYDINLGWTWDGGAWAQQVPADSNLVAMLIDVTSTPTAMPWSQRRTLAS
jgi:hypothetical protein